MTVCKLEMDKDVRMLRVNICYLEVKLSECLGSIYVS